MAKHFQSASNQPTASVPEAANGQRKAAHSTDQDELLISPKTRGSAPDRVYLVF